MRTKTPDIEIVAKTSLSSLFLLKIKTTYSRLRNRFTLQARVESRLAELEIRMQEQLTDILASKKGFGGPESLCWDKHCVQRRLLRELLDLPEVPHCAADTMAGW